MHTPLLIALFAVALRGVAAVDTCFLPPPPLAHAGAAKSLSPLAAHSKAHISIDNFPGSLIAPHATQQQIGAGGNVCYDLYAQGQDMPSELAALWQSTCATTAGPLSAAWCTQSLFQSMGLFGPENMYLLYDELRAILRILVLISACPVCAASRRV